MTEHCDFRGEPLSVGDKIAVAEGYGRRGNRQMVERTVARFTPKMIAYESPKSWSGDPDERLVSPHHVVRIS